MNEIETELIMLGTGNATVTKCYNTCFILKTKETVLLVDAGGGNGILNQLEKGGAATMVYSHSSTSKGRPVKVYELHFNSETL